MEVPAQMCGIKAQCSSIGVSEAVMAQAKWRRSYGVDVRQCSAANLT